jgi:hypothetical protein
MFTTLRKYGTHMNQFSGSKVKSLTYACPKENLYMHKGISIILIAQMFAIVRQIVACKIKVPVTKVKVTHKVKVQLKYENYIQTIK